MQLLVVVWLRWHLRMIFCDGNLLYNTVSRGALYGGRGVRDNITMLGSIVLAVCVSQGNNVFNKKKY